MNSYIIYERPIKNSLKWFVVFLVLTLLIPVVSFIEQLRPESETLATWFQRSGSLMVVFSLLAEIWAIKIFNVLNPSGFVEKGFDEVKSRFSYLPGLLSKIVLVMLGIGTLIWGYGDLVITL